MSNMPEAFGDMLFPYRGIDLYTAFDQQRPQTTPLGLNVRAYEPSTQRARGGSRPGLIEYIPQQLPLNFTGVSRKIQHLNYIVDPTPKATPGDQDNQDPNAVTDPSDPTGGPWQGNPNDPNDHNVRFHFPRRKVRQGGNGFRPNRNSLRQQVSSRKFIQQAGVSLIAPFGDESQPQYSFGLPYSSSLTPNSLLIAVLFRNAQIDDADPQPTLASALGNVMTLGANATANVFNNTQIWFWYGVNAFGASSETLTFTVFPGAFTTFENDCFAILEYSGFKTSGVLDSIKAGALVHGPPFATSLWTQGNIAVNAPNDMVLAAFCGFNNSGAANPPTPQIPANYQLRSSPSTISGAINQQLIVLDHIDVQAPEGPTVPLAQPATFAGVLASFKAA